MNGLYCHVNCQVNAIKQQDETYSMLILNSIFHDKDDDECDDEDYEDDEDVDDDADGIEEGCYHMMPRKHNCRHTQDSQVSHGLLTF